MEKHPSVTMAAGGKTCGRWFATQMLAVKSAGLHLVMSLTKIMPPPSTSDLRIPVARTRTMMKSSPDVDCVSMESVVCLSRATEMFIEELLSRTFNNNLEELNYKALSSTRLEKPRYAFLADVIPLKISGKTWIEKYQKEFDASCIH